MICLSVTKNVLNTTFELVNWGRPFLRHISFKQWSRQSLTWNAQKSYNWDIIWSIVFRKESFINAKKVLNFIQSLTNEKKVINPLTAFHILSPAPKELELMCKFLDTSYQSCFAKYECKWWIIGHAQIQYNYNHSAL